MRNLHVNMYKDLEVQVFFENEEILKQMPQICHFVAEEEPLNINEVVFLTDESLSMGTTYNGINKWYWAKDLIIKTIIRYLGDRVSYSYITSKLDLEIKLMDSFSQNNALLWINNRKIEDGWDFNRGIENAHKDTILNRQSALVVITDGSNCISTDWLPDLSYNNFYNYYFVLNFNEGRNCQMAYNNIKENFEFNETLFQNSSFNFRYIESEIQTTNFISQFFAAVAQREFVQLTPGIPNSWYEIKTHRYPESNFIQTDDTGFFNENDFESFPKTFDFMIGFQQSYQIIQQCLNYEFPDIPIPDQPEIQIIPDEIDTLPHNELQYVHFSTTILGGDEVFGQASIINQCDNWCHILGQGNYHNMSEILTNISTLNGMAISPHVRIIIYSDINYEGEIMADITGPALLNNNVYNRHMFPPFHNKQYPVNYLQLLYPEERRSWIYNMDMWKDGSMKIIFNDIPEPTTTEPPTTTTEPPITTPPPPTLECFCHISDLLVGGRFVNNWLAEIFVPTSNWCDIVPAGDYPNASTAFPKAAKGTFDGMAIGSNTRCIFYDQPNFQGNIILDEMGPLVVNNGYWLSTRHKSTVTNFHTENYADPQLQSMYPQERRMWSSTSMHTWKNGSLRIICNEEVIGNYLAIETLGIDFNQNWTIDFWVNWPILSTLDFSLMPQHKNWNNSVQHNATFNFYYYHPQKTFNWWTSTQGYIGSVHNNCFPEANKWHHIAGVKSGNELLVFMDGILINSGFVTQQITNQQFLQISGGEIPSHNRPFNGYIDELRLSNIARWTTNFTPMIQPYEKDINTKALLHMDNEELSDSSDDTRRTLFDVVHRSSNRSRFGGYSAYFPGNNIPEPPPITETPPPIQPPSNDCYVHTSGQMVGGRDDMGVSRINSPNSMYDERLGAGNYPDLKVAIPNSHLHTFDGMAISPNVHCIIYSEPNFEGSVILDRRGPAVIANNQLNSQWHVYPFQTYFSEDYPTALQSIYPQSVRSWSASNMRNWTNGSMQIICETGIIGTTDYVLCFIDEAHGTYLGTRIHQWTYDLNNWNTLGIINHKMICFNVEMSSGGGIITPYPEQSPIPIIICPRNSPQQLINDDPLTGEWIYNKIVNLYGPIPENSNIKLFIDISGSMNRSAIATGLDDFHSLYSEQLNITEYLCSNERWLRWLYNGIKGITDCT